MNKYLIQNKQMKINKN